MTKNAMGSRVGRRASTKSAIHVQCQRRTKQALRKARKAANRPANKRKAEREKLFAFAVRNVGTKREVTVMARNAIHAIEIAMRDHKLAKLESRLTVTAVGADLAA